MNGSDNLLSNERGGGGPRVLVYVIVTLFFLVNAWVFWMFPRFDTFLGLFIIESTFLIPYTIVVLFNQRVKATYKKFALSKKLTFVSSAGALPGLLYSPRIFGSYKGFETDLMYSAILFKEGSQGFWSQLTFRVPDFRISQRIVFPANQFSEQIEFLKNKFHLDAVKQFKQELDNLDFQGQLVFENKKIILRQYGNIYGKKSQNIFSNAYDLIADLIENRF